MHSRWIQACLCVVGLLSLWGCNAVSSSSNPQGQAQLKVALAGSGTGTVTSSPAGISCGQTCSASFNSGTTVMLTATPASGSTFSGWSGACSGTGACTVSLSNAQSVTATFTLSASGTVGLNIALSGAGAGTVTSNPVGINCGSTCSAQFATGTTVTLTATPASGSTFMGWSGGNCSGTGSCSVKLTSATTITATFNAPLPQLTVTKTGGGTGTVTSSPSGINCGSTCAAGFNSGTAVTLTAAPDAGNIFAGWSGACTGTGSCNVVMNAGVSVTAAFSPATVQLVVTKQGSGTGTVTSNPAGINCGSACTATFSGGTVVTLTATPGTGDTFSGWSGACTGTGPCTLTLDNAASVVATFSTSSQLTVTENGTGTGTVTSNPAGINCGSTCSASFNTGSVVTLTATPNSGYVFGGWSGACTGTGACSVTMSGSESVTATFSASLQSINHIVLFAQENRSFDQYFGAMQQYWVQNGYPLQAFDGLPQFNNPPGPIPTNPGCDPNLPPPNDCTIDSNSPQVQSYHLITMCEENTSPSWNESHNIWNLSNPVSPTPTLDGYVWAAAHDARNLQKTQLIYDTDGLRSMGYYDGGDLNYYYFLASNFATSDRWFSPVMTRTDPNREYMIAGTSQGHVYPLQNEPLLTAKTIFEALQDAGITWKIYVHADANGCTTTQCLYNQSYIQNFTYGPTILNNYPQNLVTTDQFITDAQNGTLPQVAWIEPASAVGLDEHPADNDNALCCSVEAGANYVSSLINAVMTGPNWKDSAFLFTYDEYGGFYDHVPPQVAVKPDSYSPMDLKPGDVCTQVTGPTCDFTYTGYRVPLIVISPFAKKNYVSHTVADSTAMLKFVETRFGLANLTQRDLSQMDMTEFFDFVNEPWKTPPTVPTQNTAGPCYLDHLP